jgi:N12 class adenine-specific DNA methylase
VIEDTALAENAAPPLVGRTVRIRYTDYKVTGQKEDGGYVLASISRPADRFTLSEPDLAKAVAWQHDDTRGRWVPYEVFETNIKAIKTLKALEADERTLGAEEKKALAAYAGWGGLSSYFDERMSGSGDEARLRSLLDEKEYAEARESTLTSFYTPNSIVRAMWGKIEDMGFSGGRILDPSMGTGRFFGNMPASIRSASRLVGIEQDSISGRISRLLYPDAEVHVAGFEDVPLAQGSFDLAVSNIPFGNIRLRDAEGRRYDNYLIHDYFIAKALDAVRPGGVVAFITSKGTLDKTTSSFRRYVAKEAELLGAVRLPENAFSTANTSVVSDILILRKRQRAMDTDEGFVELADSGLMQGKTPIRINRYYADNPEQIAGRLAAKKNRFGKSELSVERLDTAYTAFDDGIPQLSGAVSSRLSNIPGRFAAYMPSPDEMEEDTPSGDIEAPEGARSYSFLIVDGKAYFKKTAYMEEAKIPKNSLARMKAMVELRDRLRELIAVELEGGAEGRLTELRASLVGIYDRFADKYGRIKEPANKKIFSRDDAYYLLSSLERFDTEGNFVGKAAIFSKRTVRRKPSVDAVGTPAEALVVSMSERGKVDMRFMSALCGKSAAEMEEDLAGVIFRDYGAGGTYTHVPADQFLSGNVRQRLGRHEGMLAECSMDDPARRHMEANIRALSDVMPEPIEAEDIKIRLGATWIKPELIKQFIVELLEARSSTQAGMDVFFEEHTGEWHIKGKNSDFGVTATSTYGTERASAYRILEDALNLRETLIKDRYVDDEGRERYRLNKTATLLAQEKMDLLQKKFAEWVFADEARRDSLVTLYNERFNSIRNREYDGSHLQFGGMSMEIELRQHQRDAIARVLYGGNTLLAHRVGAGKTFEIVASAMESKRLGLANKSLVVVPNHIVEQFADDWYRLYPSANILVAKKSDFETANRKAFCSRIATGDYDAVIIGHSQFEKIPMSPQWQEQFIERQIDELNAAIDDIGSGNVRATDRQRHSVKALEQRRKNLETKVKKLFDQKGKDQAVYFDELGCDRLFVDEAHNYKNLFLATKMRNVAGVQQTNASKSDDMFMKCRFMDEKTGGRGVVFATGTPVSNSMTELYTMQRYLQHGHLEDAGLLQFDAWASVFGENVTSLEVSPEGKGLRNKTRFAKFNNVPEMMAIFKEVADVKVEGQLGLKLPECVYHTLKSPASSYQRQMVDSIAERAETIRAGQVDPAVDNMLKVTGDGRKLALDQRLIDPALPRDENGKTALCVKTVHRVWDETEEDRSTQIVFCDIGTPGTGGTFDVYNDMKRQLIALGIPEHEIAFIHDADNEAKREELFSKMRDGSVRILFGSTQKLGTGTNVQDRLIALHDLDCPWRPSDLEQRLGRMVRQGNQNAAVHSYRYVTENTFDSYMYQKIESKQRFVSQIMTARSPVREMEDIDDDVLKYAEIKAIATGNPMMVEKADLEADIQRLEILQSGFETNRYRLKNRIATVYPNLIEGLRELVQNLAKDKDAAGSTDTEGFTGITLNGVTHLDKEAAAKALAEAQRGAASGKDTRVGEYRGFKLLLRRDEEDTESVSLVIEGAARHKASFGGSGIRAISNIDACIGKIAQVHAAHEEKLDAAQKDLEQAKAEVLKDFPEAEALVQKRKRIAQLNEMLDLDRQDHEFAGEEGDDAHGKDGNAVVLSKADAARPVPCSENGYACDAGR